MSGKRIKEVLIEAKKELKEASIENFAQETEWFLMEVLGCSRVELILKAEEIISEVEIQLFQAYIEERKTHKPFQYIIGYTEFMGLTFSVGEGVLIPRADTEILVETILKNTHHKKHFQRGLDLCTGTACIPISLELHTKSQGQQPIQMTAVDISQEALHFAKENIKKHSSRVQLLEMDVLRDWDLLGEETYDFIVSNPPYITKKEMQELMEEVRDYEPHLALCGGESGLLFYETIVEKSGAYLKDGGFLFFEIGCEQGEAVKRLMEEAGFLDCVVVKDYANLDRVVYGKRAENRPA